MFRFSVVAGGQLTADLMTHWSAWQSCAPPLDSPFFRPEFIQTVAAVRNDVEVGVVEESGQVVGLFPYQRGWRNVATPVVGKLSEFHGLIASRRLPLEAETLLRGFRLSAWQFDHLATGQPAFDSGTWAHSTSPFMDLSQGYEAYAESRRLAGSSGLRQVLRKSRKMEREVGPLRFEYHSADPSTLEALISWKTEQHLRTKRFPVLQSPRIVDLLSRLRDTHTPGFRGLCSTLFAGDELVAIHLGLCSQQALHIWFPAYNQQFARYSPGLVLLLELARRAATEGMQRIDFGKGTERYKQDFKSGDIPLGVGAVDRRPVTGPLRAGWYRTKCRIRDTRFRGQLEAALRLTNSVRDRFAFR